MPDGSPDSVEHPGTPQVELDRKIPFSRRIAALPRPRWARNAWFGTRYFLGSHRATWPLLRFAPAPYARVMVRRGMDACIEGLPRSANTFGTIAFVARNPTAEIAHHVHLPMQFQRAVDLGVPCVVLIREPVGNLTSLVIAGENDLSHDLAFRVYIHYYRRIAELRDRLSLCDFGEVSSDPSVIARRLNERFGTTFDAEPMGTEEQQGIRSLIEDAQEETHLRPAHGTVPSEFKERLKPALRAELEKHPLLPTARALYDELLSSIRP